MKIVLIGPEQTGKSSYVDKLVNWTPPSTYHPTVSHRTVRTSCDGVEVELVDCAGSLRYRDRLGELYRGADGVIVMFDAPTLTLAMDYYVTFCELTGELENGRQIPAAFLQNKVTRTRHRTVKRYKSGRQFLLADMNVDLDPPEELASVVRWLIYRVKQQALPTHAHDEQAEGCVSAPTRAHPPSLIRRPLEAGEVPPAPQPQPDRPPRVQVVQDDD